MSNFIIAKRFVLQVHDQNVLWFLQKFSEQEFTCVSHKQYNWGQKCATWLSNGVKVYPEIGVVGWSDSFMQIDCDLSVLNMNLHEEAWHF